MEYILKPFEHHKKLAVLIDADNTPSSVVKGVLDETAKYGVASVKRIYGNWTSPQLQSWKEMLLKFSIQPIQHFNYTSGKNATDSAMIIDAMDLLYTHKFDGFCLVSSDSDFTRLAMRIRESGLMVYGFGRNTTPKPFVESCDKFIFTENVEPEATEILKPAQQPTITRTYEDVKDNKKLLSLLYSGVDDSSDDSGWASLSLVTQNMQKKSSEFDPRNYGFKKMFELIKATDLFEIDERIATEMGAKSIYIKPKQHENDN